MPKRRKWQEPWQGSGFRQIRYWEDFLTDPSYVYVIRAEGQTALKVGVAKDVKARIDSLQTGNPAFLQLLVAVPGDYRLEAFIHQEMKGAWIRGEWFDGPALEPFLKWINALSRRMIRHHKRTGELPDYRVSVRSSPAPKKKEPNPVTVRWVEPNPKVPTEVAQEMRRSVRGCSSSVYNPLDTTIFQATPGRAKNGGR